MIMFSALLTLALTGAASPSPGYFSHLTRPRVAQLSVARGGGPVILIVVDAMRPDHLSAYGYERPTTPAIKALADDGVVLTNYFVNGNWTRPSTASLVTGLMPAEHGVESEQDKLAEQYVTLAETLRDLGVPTGAVVGNGNAGSAFGLGQGFSYYADTVNHWQGLPSAEQVTELALPFVREHQSEPFFLMLFFVDAHNPYGAPPPYEDMYVRDPTAKLVRSPHWEVGRYTPAEIERMQATYDGALRYTDETLGKFFATLKELGIYDRATIVVTADHGEAFGEHGVFMHSHHLYDEIIRAPLIVRAPQMSVRGGYFDELIQTVDLMPTLVRYFGGTVLTRRPGIDIFEQMRDENEAGRRRTVITDFNTFGIRRRTIRDRRHKVILEEPADEATFMATVGRKDLLPSVSFDHERIQLYDLATDPFERHDLYTAKRASSDPWRTLVAVLRGYRLATPKAAGPHIVRHIDPETYQDLKALGYIQ